MLYEIMLLTDTPVMHASKFKRMHSAKPLFTNGKLYPELPNFLSKYVHGYTILRKFVHILPGTESNVVDNLL